MAGGSSDPWLGDLVTAVILLLVGAGISIFTASKTDRKKNAREDSQRWDEQLVLRADSLVEALHALYMANYEAQVAVNAFSEDSTDEKRQDVLNTTAAVALALRIHNAARNALFVVAGIEVMNASTELMSAFSPLQTGVESRSLPPQFPEGDALPNFIYAVRLAAGVPHSGVRSSKTSE
jgi:hypothetical protein